MASKFTQLRVFSGIAAAVVLGLVASCTDKREPKKEPFTIRQTRPTPPLDVIEAVADVQYRGGNTETLQMVQARESIYMTGKPFGYAQWEVLSNPELPHLTAAMAEQIDNFSPMGRWLPDNYAAGALAIFQNLAIMSGRAGASVVDVRDSAKPIEVRRYPAVSPKQDVIPEDTRYQWKAIGIHPNQPYIYGFREQDAVFTIRVQSPDLLMQSRMDYSPGGTVCCVAGATTFAGKIFVAFRSALYYFTPSANGALGAGTGIGSVQAVNVASTQKYLYVQHQPNPGSPIAAQSPAGIYVFDTTGEPVAYLPVGGIQFAVSPNDTHLFVNETNDGIRIYRILWTNL